jgi:hypothetical protein
MRMLIDLTGKTKLQTFLGRLLLLLTPLVWWGMGVDAQEVPGREDVHLLPEPTGEAFTLTPTDMPDVNCSIVEWKGDTSKPTLAVVCPPQDTFAPLHLYLKLSWLKSEDVPLYVRSITVPAKTNVKMRTTGSTAWMLLAVKEKPTAAARRTWVGFNAVVDIALLTIPRRR